MKAFQQSSRGLSSLAKGFALLKEKNRTPALDLAAASFEKMVRQVLIAGVFGIFGLFALLYFITPYTGIVRVGSRQGDEIHFFYRSEETIPYDSGNIALEPGEKVVLYLDGAGKPVSFESYAAYESAQNAMTLKVIILFPLYVGLLVLIIYLIQKNSGRQWHEYLVSGKKQAGS